MIAAFDEEATDVEVMDVEVMDAEVIGLETRIDLGLEAFTHKALRSDSTSRDILIGEVGSNRPLAYS